MIKKQSIIVGYHRYGKSKKRLARELGISVKTVRKYLIEHEQAMASAGLPAGELPAQGIISAPRYKSHNRVKPVLTKAVTEAIDAYLEANKKKRLSGRPKQQMKKIDIYQALIESGYRISYSSVRRYINEKSARLREVFIHQHYEAGQCLEFDWGEVSIELGGKMQKLMMAVFTSCYSNHRWARLYHRQDMSSFLDSHAQYFAYTGVVQQQVLYDNMKTAVSKYTLCNDKKTPTQALLKMSCYYQYQYRFCNAGKGNEKGHVERSVEYVRRKAFARQDKFSDLEQANAYLLACCERLNRLPLSGQTTPIEEVFEQERAYMKPAGPPYDASELLYRKVNKYNCVQVDNNWYSVPERYSANSLNIKLYPHQILIYSADNQLLASHARRFTRHEYYLQLEHYLVNLRNKPGALAGSLALRQAEKQLQQIFKKHFEVAPRDFVELLLYMRENGYNINHLQEALKAHLELCPHQSAGLDRLKVLLRNQLACVAEPPSNQTDTFTQQIAGQSTALLKSIQQLFLSQNKTT